MAVTNSTRVITPELFEQEYNASISKLPKAGARQRLKALQQRNEWYTRAYTVQGQPVRPVNN
jgi:hypothetical protein